ncbi:MAG: [LysW]-aminoadipate/[LysW]-glutamate kinase [Conexivisphaerales archaeon]|nr:[LysW]-aminoadipate/[LysW]-glutamate kinase [Conexivisphaerales archaeon]
MSQITVIKIGGSLVSEGEYINVLNDIKSSGLQNFILVHGGGNEVSKLQKALGKEPVFVTSPEGIRSRYTDLETLEIFNMTMRNIGTKITSHLNSLGLRAVNVSGVDASFIKAERKRKLIIIDEKGRKRVIEGGFTGRIKEVDASFLKSLLNLGLIPVVSPIASGYEGEILNVDGDRGASAIASSVGASKLIIFTNVEGVIIDGKVLDKLSLEEAKETLKKVGPGMDKKLLACIEAVEKGVDSGIIASGKKEKPIESALNGIGTKVVRG